MSACVLALVGCQSAASRDDASTETSVDSRQGQQGTGGDGLASGGSRVTGGASGSAGTLAAGGVIASGGTIATGGSIGSGGALAAGGSIAAGGTIATGGDIADGGSLATGGVPGSGGTLATGGRLGSGGALATGGYAGAGGTAETGGSKNRPDASSDAASCTGWSTLVHLTPQQLKDLLAAQDVFLINVRSPNAPNIAGTDLDLQTATDASPTVTAIENFVNHNTCADIVIYCVTGGTSQRVATQLISDGYLRVRDLQGGITAWQAQGFPVARADGGAN